MFDQDIEKVRFEPAGAWVDTLSVNSGRCEPEKHITGGRRFWLSDLQIDLRWADAPSYCRTVTEALTADGVQAVANFEAVFDPSYQRLVIHHIRIVRHGDVTDIDAKSLVQVFRRERDLERARFDGRLTAHVLIPDVRIDDLVDVAFTLEGQNPALKGAFATRFRLQWGAWVDRTHVRVIVPHGREVAIENWGDAPPPRCSERDDGAMDIVWAGLRDPGPAREADTPFYVRSEAGAAISDTLTWTHVADIFREAYTPPPELPTSLAEACERLRSESIGSGEQIVAALRLVQSEIRYCAINIGDGGFVPRTIEHIWQTRSGDCKDKSRLLTAILLNLGFDAAPALINTYISRHLVDEKPKIDAFNHYIVRIRHDGKIYWVDPTKFPQGGRLELLVQSGAGWALPLVASAALEWMDPGPTPLVCSLSETYELGSTPTASGRCEVITVYRSWRADDLRRRLANEGLEQVANEWLKFYVQAYEGARILEPTTIQDDLHENALTIREVYELSRPCKWQVGEVNSVFTTADKIFAANLPMMRTQGRRAPIEIGWPRRLEAETRVLVPSGVSISTFSRVFSAAGVRRTFECYQGPAGRTEVMLSRLLEIDGVPIPVEEANSFYDLRDSVVSGFNLKLTLPVENGRLIHRRGKAKRKGFAVNNWRIWWLLAVAVIYLLQYLAGIGQK